MDNMEICYRQFFHDKTVEYDNYVAVIRNVPLVNVVCVFYYGKYSL